MGRRSFASLAEMESDKQRLWQLAIDGVTLIRTGRDGVSNPRYWIKDLQTEVPASTNPLSYTPTDNDNQNLLDGLNRDLIADPRFEVPEGGRTPPVELDDCVAYAHWWKEFGASLYWVTAPWADLGPEETGIREPGKAWSGIEPRLRALAEFKKAVGDDF